MKAGKRISMMALSLLITMATASLAVSQQPPKVRLPQASPSATVSQTVGITDMAITYHRPSVRGRTLWGDISSEKVAALIKANSVAPAADQTLIAPVVETTPKKAAEPLQPAAKVNMIKAQGEASTASKLARWTWLSNPIPVLTTTRPSVVVSR